MMFYYQPGHRQAQAKNRLDDWNRLNLLICVPSYFIFTQSDFLRLFKRDVNLFRKKLKACIGI